MASEKKHGCAETLERSPSVRPIDVFIYEPFDFAREFASAKRELVIGEVESPVVSYSTLIRLKREAGREKDLLDIQALSKLDRYR